MSETGKPDTISRLTDGLANVIDAILRVIIVAGFSGMVICVVWQVMSRYILRAPSIYTDEIARFLFIWMALIGGAYTFGKGRHLAIEILAPALKGWRKQLAQLAVVAVIAFFAIAVMINGGSALVARTLANGQVSPALQMPMGYVYFAIPASGAFILIYCIQMAVRLFHGMTPVEAPPAEAGGPLD
ncbi:TRAP transporter small permease [Martelella mangrovi]|uniref:TRAP transporter small permease protein n=1 Tax=Martelella mangrovi TaxID=1397477 RepID=A0ABV2IBC3_9HYPH|nr:TRAP transporter small permease [uncultured Martelella sp.]